MTLPCWAIDPGKTGAAALVRWARPESATDAFDLLCAVAWREVEAGYLLKWNTDRSCVVASLGAIGPVLALESATPYTLCMEALFVPTLARAPSCLVLAEAAGEVVAGLRAYQQGETLRPHPSTWRGRMLGSAALGAKAAARRSLEVAALRVRGGLGALAGNEHAADAALMACWGAVEAGRA